jgi:hypothetical protein
VLVVVVGLGAVVVDVGVVVVGPDETVSVMVVVLLTVPVGVILSTVPAAFEFFSCTTLI